MADKLRPLSCRCDPKIEATAKIGSLSSTMRSCAPVLLLAHFIEDSMDGRVIAEKLALGQS